MIKFNRFSFKRFIKLAAIVFPTLWVTLLFLLRNPAFTSAESITSKVVPEVRELRDHVKFLSELRPNRSFENAESLEKAQSYIEERFRAYGYKVTIQDVPASGRIFHNVIARYGDPSNSQDLVVIGAHYDACETDNPGADDNASGVAGLLELARLFELNRPAVGSSIEFVAYTLEEPPYFKSDRMGSAVHAKALADKGVNVRYMISLEMIGYFSDRPFSQQFLMPVLYSLYPATGDFIGVVGRPGDRDITKAIKRSMNANSEVEAYSINAPPFIPGIDFSDHLNYWEHDWPAVMVTDTAFLRNDQYHKDGDTPGRLDYERMAEVVRGVYAALVQN